MLNLLIFTLVFSSTGLICSQVIPLISERFRRFQEKKVNEAEKKLEKIFIGVNRERLFLFYTLIPLIMGLVTYFFFNNLVFVLIAVGIGFTIPTIIIKRLEALRKARFSTQLVDALITLTSSLKGGLSLLQAIEVLVEEMPAPISQEFGLILRENMMGIPLEESFKRLNERMKIEELGLIINSILVARETGGDLTKVFSRLSNTIRDRHKLKESIKTLTLQGRLQGMIMSVLPFIFIFFVYTFNPQHFNIMLENELGKSLLILAVILQLMGMLLIRKFSLIRI